MKIFVWLLRAASLLMLLSLLVLGDEVHTGGQVCPNPSSPCKSSGVEFGPEALSFHLPAKLKWQTNYYSAPFYAIILKSRKAVPDPDGPAGSAECAGYFSERERLEAQSLFPKQKVFASRFGCVGIGVAYTNVNYNFDFVAVYAGESAAAANGFLMQVKALGKFPGANIRKMQVVLEYGD